MLVVSTGLLVVGADAVFFNTPTLTPGADRMTMDSHWLRDNPAAMVVRMNPCDMRDILILSRASNPDDPIRSQVDMPHFIFRPGDINLNGVAEPTDYIAFTQSPYDYNLDGYLNSSDYIGVLTAIQNMAFCE